MIKTQSIVITLILTLFSLLSVKADFVNNSSIEDEFLNLATTNRDVNKAYVYYYFDQDEKNFYILVTHDFDFDKNTKHDAELFKFDTATKESTKLSDYVLDDAANRILDRMDDGTILIEGSNYSFLKANGLVEKIEFENDHGLIKISSYKNSVYALYYTEDIDFNEVESGTLFDVMLSKKDTDGSETAIKLLKGYDAGLNFYKDEAKDKFYLSRFNLNNRTDNFYRIIENDKGSVKLKKIFNISLENYRFGGFTSSYGYIDDDSYFYEVSDLAKRSHTIYKYDFKDGREIRFSLKKGFFNEGSNLYFTKKRIYSFESAIKDKDPNEISVSSKKRKSKRKTFIVGNHSPVAITEDALYIVKADEITADCDVKVYFIGVNGLSVIF